MASYKKVGQCNIVTRGQYWKNIQNGRIGQVVKKANGGGGKVWVMNIGRKSHHINEGTLLKFFILIEL